ncbi:hypothetical protein [Nocardia sp. XZ_19_231]|uniref:hypothetical protein n=1 Tax=Nocardia sp. XZ_19_231 TaxID=2769252 RepID=UPI00188E5B20|nr:hypothetical protein [Nocardia sp. XZ_19_231]
MLSGRETSKLYAVRAAAVGSAVIIGLLGSAGTAAALPGSASGSASGSANLATGSAAASASVDPAVASYLTWQSAQLIHNTLRVLLSIPMRNI